MSRCVLACLVVCAASSVVLGGSTTTLLDENFESGLGGWTVKNNLGKNDDNPAIFDADGNGPSDAAVYGGNIVYGGKAPYSGMPAASHVAGYSSGIVPPDGWDGSSPQWIEKQWHLDPGTYDIELDLDRYLSYDGESTDYWAVGNRVYLLTDLDYAIPRDQWVSAGTYDSNSAFLSPGSFRRTLWRGDGSNGVWQHLNVHMPTTVTTTGNFVLRLLMHEKYSGQQSILWDNLVLKVKQGGQDVAGFPFTEGFEAGLAANGWMAYSRWLLGSNGTPFVFTPTDSRLYTNTGNSGSQSAGFSSNLSVSDQTSEWLRRQLPAAVSPGTYSFHLEFDRYIYQADQSDPWGLGNRVLLLTDNLYDNPTWNFDSPGPFVPSFRWDYWSGDNSEAFNGVWHHEVIDDALTTLTGNIEIRLLQHDKHTGAQAVAWDNVKLTLALPCNDPWADVNGDHFVDMLDFAILQTCLTTDPVFIPPSPLPGECRCFDRTGGSPSGGDGKIIDADMTEFLKCVTGPGIPWVKPADCNAQ